jgi:cytoskeletal protein CcmA (bactofilin family)
MAGAETDHGGTMGNREASATTDPRTVGSMEGRVTLGRSMVVKGELTGSEDLIVDGQVEGRIHLSDHTLTIGPEAHIGPTWWQRS